MIRFYDLVFEKLTNYCIEEEIIQNDDEEIVVYGLKSALFMLLNFITTLLIGIIFNMVVFSLIFVSTFILTRTFSGGYHASSPAKCFIYSVILQVIMFFLLVRINIGDNFLFMMTFFSGIIIFSFSPVESQNKKLTIIEKKRLKKKSRKVLFIFLFVVILCFAIGNLLFVKAIAMSLLMSSILILVGKYYAKYEMIR